MRVAFATFLRYAPLFVLPPATGALDSRTSRPDALTLLEYDAETAYAKFLFPCTDCSTADESLIFGFQISPAHDTPTWDVTFAGSNLALLQDDANVVRNTQTFSVLDSSAHDHTVNITWILSPSSLADAVVLRDQPLDDHPHDPTESLSDLLFVVNSVDNIRSPSRSLGGFAITIQSAAIPRLTRLFALPQYLPILFAELGDSYMSGTPREDEEKGQSVRIETVASDADFDFEDEAEALDLLEAQAEDLRVQIAAKKQAISNHLRQQRDSIELRALIEECDGIVCAAKVIAQRVCDMVGIPTEVDFSSAQSEYQLLQHAISFDDESHKPQQTPRNCTKSKKPGIFAANKFSTHSAASSMPVTLTKNESSHSFDFPEVPSNQEASSLLRVLNVVAVALGLAAIITFLRQKCMSMRKRVERAADKEARRNERAYRRAARRVLLRKRWDGFIKAISCFRQDAEPTIQDYEEKRALILQDAFLEQDLEAAEKGEVMEAEIRELRYAHEIISSLVRVDNHRYDLITPVNDPPPPLVPLPYTPATRSRASTGTLPSYTSESLPDYSSQPSEGARSSRSSSIIVDGFTQYTPSESDEGDAQSPPSTVSNNSEHTKFTPTSSILETTPRVSQETFRTRQSGNV